MTEQWPVFCEELNYAAEEADFEKLMDYIKAVRTIRAEMNVHPAKRSSMIIETSETEAFAAAAIIWPSLPSPPT